ncbi:hypothetical protein [Streptomyces griseorubiginosus]|uniref:hypothetical protein n=1 Tax=Streptomyces griseorubiginosus TaxID=67304 RepID=UPI002E80D8F1|nr:hypothetical protein [Streptomyces griseorubiginosus]WUB45327.1 hypothetical protein OHN19_19030 [Streptomyces griseorubiginosus]WUB53844.1 hypothetical protein OG942_19025 [Streptomyces griseorubiginosus]
MPEQETAANVRTGETVTREVATADEAYVAALLREREGYARMEREDRVQAVDAELERLGYVWEEKVVDDGEDEDAGGDGKDGPPAPPADPVTEPKETAAESKPRRTARTKS